MKRLQHKLVPVFFLFIVMIASSGFLAAQESRTEFNEKESNTQAMIDAQRYVFKAQSAHPTRGRIIQLNSEYELAVLNDTIRTYLPYFGRAYSAPMNGRGGGIDFTSKDFDYNLKNRRKGGWDITIKPKDVSDIREINMTVYENKFASVRVSSNNKEPISFNGYIAQKK